MTLGILMNRRSKVVGFLAILLTGMIASGHATLVLGAVTSEPDVPLANQPFALKLQLVSPTQVPIEDAWVLAEFRPKRPATNGKVFDVRFNEGGAPGLYQAQVTLPANGTYALRLRDQTYRQEEAQADLVFNVGRRTSLDARSFVFPPTATGLQTQSLQAWLLWIIGLPLLAAVAVTIAVLTMGKKPAAEGERQRQADGGPQ